MVKRVIYDEENTLDCNARTSITQIFGAPHIFKTSLSKDGIHYKNKLNRVESPQLPKLISQIAEKLQRAKFNTRRFKIFAPAVGS